MTATRTLDRTGLPAPRPSRGTPPAGGPAARPQGRVRLTRRGRLVLVLVVAALLTAAFSLDRVSSTAATDPAGAAELRTVVVQPGDTLWELAETAVPAADPRDTIDRIKSLNALPGGPGGDIAPGQRLVLPAG